MANKNPPILDADPHTLAKIEILKNYLNAWFPIVASRFSDLVYIDGFSGPGSYSNHPEGSPVAALNVFKSWILKDPDRLKISKVSAIFIEADSKRFEILDEKINGIKLPTRLRALPIKGKFEDVMSQLIYNPEYACCFNGRQPLLIFADPFGGTGVPFNLLENCLVSQGSELLLNFDADGISRIHAGKNAGWQKQLDDVFGCREWEMVLENPNDSLVRRSEHCLDLYKRRLSEIEGVDFVWSFEMRGRNDRINYYLVFASRNRLGMEKMKEAMRALDKTGQYCFSDAHHNQHVLFRADDVEFFAPILHEKYLGLTKNYEDLVRHALCETPFSNPKGMLEWLSRREMITVQARLGETLKAHSFPEERVESITFVRAPARETQTTFFEIN